MGSVTLAAIGQVVIWLGMVCGALGAIGVVVRWVLVHSLQPWIRREIAAVKAPLAEVHAEVKPNHGTSMKDQLTRVETSQETLAARFEDHLTNHPGAS